MPQYYDQDADGYSETLSYDLDGNGHDEVFAVDTDRDGIFDVQMTDANRDGFVDAQFTDADQDGFSEHIVADSDFDGRYDSYAADQNGDRVMDVSFVDANHNGIDDRTEVAAPSGGFVIGGPDAASGHVVTVEPSTVNAGLIGPMTNPDPLVSLILDLTAQTGHVVYGPSDRDGDQYDDHEDRHPGDPFRA